MAHCFIHFPTVDDIALASVLQCIAKVETDECLQAKQEHAR